MIVETDENTNESLFSFSRTYTEYPNVYPIGMGIIF